MIETLIEAAASAIEAAAAAVLVYGAATAFLRIAWMVVRGRATHRAQREAWLGLARWLVLSLEFQLASDLLHTAVAPTWTEIGRVAAIALIRTFLNHALESDLEKASRPEGGARADRLPGPGPEEAAGRRPAAPGSARPTPPPSAAP